MLLASAILPGNFFSDRVIQGVKMSSFYLVDLPSAIRESLVNADVIFRSSDVRITAQWRQYNARVILVRKILFGQTVWRHYNLSYPNWRRWGEKIRKLGSKSDFVLVGCQYGSKIDGRLWKSGSTKRDDPGLSQPEVPGVFEDGGRSARIQQDHA